MFSKLFYENERYLMTERIALRHFLMRTKQKPLNFIDCIERMTEDIDLKCHSLLYKISSFNLRLK